MQIAGRSVCHAVVAMSLQRSEKIRVGSATFVTTLNARVVSMAAGEVTVGEPLMRAALIALAGC